MVRPSGRGRRTLDKRLEPGEEGRDAPEPHEDRTIEPWSGRLVTQSLVYMYNISRVRAVRPVAAPQKPRGVEKSPDSRGTGGSSHTRKAARANNLRDEEAQAPRYVKCSRE